MYKLARIVFGRFSFFRAIVMFDAACATGLPPKCVKTSAVLNSGLQSTTASFNFKVKTKINHNNYHQNQICSNHHNERNSFVPKPTTYEEAIKALNGLMSNAATIQKSIQRQQNHIADTLKYLQRIDITPDKLDRLPVIHVSGTKGKGSTCALTESILRSFGIKTGFFSSPHLISVVERIRINGKPISRELFAKYFWQVYNTLNEHKENDEDMPPYFKFLTILSFKIFMEENVDVAIMEVGIGGENDCTNVVRNTKTVGITSLGLEHTNLLGNTLSDIAWQKAGIIKPNSNVFTSRQPEECMKVIRERTNEKNAKLFIVPDFAEYKWTRWPNLQINSKVQQINASIAIQLSYDWLKRTNKIQQIAYLNDKIHHLHNNDNVTMTLDVCEEVVQGLEKCFWPGRCQMIEVRNKRIFLDGAHTKESMEICCDWFIKSTVGSTNKKFLIFNTTGERDSRKLLKILGENINFTKAYFVPNTPFIHMQTDDINTSWYPQEQQMQRVNENYEFWTSIFGKTSACKFNDILDALMHLHKQIISADSDGNDNDKQELQLEQEKQVDVLVTGSLHLIGATLLALEEFEKRGYDEHLNV